MILRIVIDNAPNIPELKDISITVSLLPIPLAIVPMI